MYVPNIRDLSTEDLEHFLNSFDTILCDYDGVVINEKRQFIPDAYKSLALLQNLGKRVIFLSNNSLSRLNKWHQTILNSGFKVNIDDLVNPRVATIHFLREMKLEKPIYVVATEEYKKEMKDAGFKLVEDKTSFIGENYANFCEFNEFIKNKEVGAVIIDFDFNITYGKILSCAKFLSNPDVLFIIGGNDTKILFLDDCIVGPGYFQDIVSTFTGRKPIQIGKPSTKMNDFVKTKYNLNDSSRVLMIGDSLKQDISFANSCGYTSLLVLTGLTKLEDLQKTSKEETPDFYIPSLGDLCNIIENKANKIE